jgi:phosphatidate cytidylyltransferase
MLAITACLFEFYELVNAHKDTRINVIINSFGGLMLFMSVANLACGMTDASKYCFATFLLYIVAVLVSELYNRRSESFTRAAYIFFGHFYITLPLSLFYILAFRNGSYEWIRPLALFVFIWTNDTFAYLTGVTFGRHRLFERISPNKSWEGFFGGLLFTLASSFVFAWFCSSVLLIHWLFLSMLTVVFATFGDLVESLIKRTFNVKDSGNALPGHGGFLDRFDSLLFAIYAMLVFELLL